jgi:hypothetical protein
MVVKKPKIKGDYMDYFLGKDPRKHKDYKHFLGEKSSKKK